MAEFDTKEDAELAVRAVNNHDKLLESLEEVMQVAFDGPKEAVDIRDYGAWKDGIAACARAAIEEAQS